MAIIRSSKTVAAAGNYTNGDIMSESATVGTAWAFRGVPNHGGNGIIIDSALITCTDDAFLPVCTLHLFDANPSASSLNDNDALSIHDDDVGKYLGSIVFTILVDRGPVATVDVKNVGLAVRPNEHLSIIYGLLEVVTTETDESVGMTVEITLGFHQEAQF